MPNPKPTKSAISKPVEPSFRPLAKRVIQETHEYDLSKYPQELHTFDGRYGDWQEEWVSMGRYVTALEMEYKVARDLLRRYIVEDDNLCGEDCHCINCTEARIVLAQPEPRV